MHAMMQPQPTLYMHHCCCSCVVVDTAARELVLTQARPTMPCIFLVILRRKQSYYNYLYMCILQCDYDCVLLHMCYRTGY